MMHYDICPVCSSPDIQFFERVKDHSVSGEFFEVWHCNKCTTRFTQDAPSEAAIGPYYKTEDYISHTDSAKGLINSVYHKVRRLTISRKRKLLEKYCGKQGSLLDIGCGTGSFLAEMQQHKWDAAGLEPDETARQIASSKHQIMAREPAALFNFEREIFDAITMWHVLEHVHTLDSYMQQINKILKPAGRFFIAVPNYTSKDALTYGADWAAWDVPRHLYHFSPKGLKTLAERHGFLLEQMLPMWFDSVYVSMLSEKYKGGSLQLTKAMFTGLRSNLAATGKPENCSSVIYILKKQPSA